MSDERAHGDPQKILKNSTNRQLPIDIENLSAFKIVDWDRVYISAEYRAQLSANKLDWLYGEFDV